MVLGLRIMIFSLGLAFAVTLRAEAQQTPVNGNSSKEQMQVLREDIQTLREKIEPLQLQMKQLIAQMKALRDQMLPIEEKMKADRDQMRALHVEHVQGKHPSRP
jgi:predicted  nucleic acid-binding Zn-ribbon protein